MKPRSPVAAGAVVPVPSVPPGPVAAGPSMQTSSLGADASSPTWLKTEKQFSPDASSTATLDCPAGIGDGKRRTVVQDDVLGLAPGGVGPGHLGSGLVVGEVLHRRRPRERARRSSRGSSCTAVAVGADSPASFTAWSWKQYSVFRLEALLDLGRVLGSRARSSSGTPWASRRPVSPARPTGGCSSRRRRRASHVALIALGPAAATVERRRAWPGPARPPPRSSEFTFSGRLIHQMTAMVAIAMSGMSSITQPGRIGRCSKEASRARFQAFSSSGAAPASRTVTVKGCRFGGPAEERGRGLHLHRDRTGASRPAVRRRTP